MSLNAITDPRIVKMKLEKSEEYRMYTLVVRHIAKASDQAVKTADEFEEATARLKRIKGYSTRLRAVYYKSIRSLIKSATWRLIGSRMIYHEDKETMYFLMSALGRPRPKPQPVKASVKVQVRRDRKPIKLFGFTL